MSQKKVKELKPLEMGIECIPTHLERAMRVAEVTPCFLSIPGASKSSQVKDWCVANGHGLVSFIGTQRNQPDVGGYQVPVKREGYTATVSTFPSMLEEVKVQIEAGFKTGLVFLDEVMSTDVLIKKALASFISDRSIGEFELPDGWQIVCAGNRLEDDAGVTPTPKQLINRLMLIPVRPTFKGWYPWAIKQSCHHLMIRAMEENEGVFITDKVPLTTVPYPTLRSYWLSHQYICAGLTQEEIDNSTALPIDDYAQQGVEGLIGTAASTTLMGFLESWGHLPTRMQILKDPDKAKMPEQDDMASMFTLSEMIVSMAEVKNMDTVWTYAQRMSKELLAATGEKLVAKDQRLLTSSKVFTQWAIDEGSFLNASFQ